MSSLRLQFDMATMGVRYSKDENQLDMAQKIYPLVKKSKDAPPVRKEAGKDKDNKPVFKIDKSLNEEAERFEKHHKLDGEPEPAVA